MNNFSTSILFLQRNFFGYGIASLADHPESIEYEFNVIAYHHALGAIPDAFLAGELDQSIVLKVIPFIASFAFLAVSHRVAVTFLAISDDSF
jgi:hypothetical protein